MDTSNIWREKVGLLRERSGTSFGDTKGTVTFNARFHQKVLKTPTGTWIATVYGSIYYVFIVFIREPDDFRLPKQKPNIITWAWLNKTQR